MRVKKFPESGPKRRLLDAAEVLFAERGFEAVSVRDITNLAEANVAALNYHFGTREEMIDLLIHHYLNPIQEERLLRLEMVERKWAGKIPPLEEICDAYLRPLQCSVKKTSLSEAMLHKLLGRMFALPCETMPPAAQQLMLNAESRLIRVLAKSLPTVTSEELAWKVHFLDGAVIQLLLGREPLRASATSTTTEALIGRLTRFAAAGLREGQEVSQEEVDGSQAIFDF